MKHALVYCSSIWLTLICISACSLDKECVLLMSILATIAETCLRNTLFVWFHVRASLDKGDFRMVAGYGLVSRARSCGIVQSRLIGHNRGNASSKAVGCLWHIAKPHIQPYVDFYGIGFNMKPLPPAHGSRTPSVSRRVFDMGTRNEYTEWYDSDWSDVE